MRPVRHNQQRPRLPSCSRYAVVASRVRLPAVVAQASAANPVLGAASSAARRSCAALSAPLAGTKTAEIRRPPPHQAPALAAAPARPALRQFPAPGVAFSGRVDGSEASATAAARACPRSHCLTCLERYRSRPRAVTASAGRPSRCCLPGIFEFHNLVLDRI